MSVKFLSAEYFDAVAEVLNANDEFRKAAKGKGAMFVRTTTGAPSGGDIVFWMRVDDDGSVAFGPGEVENADCRMEESYETALAVSKGDLDGNDAFMKGKTRVSGSMIKTMQLVPAFRAMTAPINTLDIEY